MRIFYLFLFFVFLAMPSLSYAAMQDYPIVKLQALDKSTARTLTFEAKVGTTIEYGSLFIKVQSCRKSEPLDKPESAAFLQIWEVPLNATKSEWAFSGWMFASSPALSAMDHAVYDVWVLDCLGETKNPPPEKTMRETTADQGELEAVDSAAEAAAVKEAEEAAKQKEVEAAASAEAENAAAPSETPQQDNDAGDLDSFESVIDSITREE